jgi:hypothetical protein
MQGTQNETPEFEAAAFALWVDDWIWARNEGLSDETPVRRGRFTPAETNKKYCEEEIVYV